jgi:uncharacterized repeat protein (TIGR03803 family)
MYQPRAWRGGVAVAGLLLAALSLPDCSSLSGGMAQTRSTDGERHRAVAAFAAGYSVIYDFSVDEQGPFYPVGGLYVDRAGNIFGTSTGGGTTFGGTVFEVERVGGYYAGQVIHSFDCAVDGCGPNGAPIEDDSGTIYATTPSGTGSKSGGSAIELQPAGSGYRERRAHIFGIGTDGAGPNAALTKHAHRLFATTTHGGMYGNGTIVALEASGLRETVVHDFAGTSNGDGANPTSTLVEDATGALYGTTEYGGPDNIGTVFKFVPNGDGGTETIIHGFTVPGDGYEPTAGVVLDSAGNLYGTTSGGGASADGTVYELSPASGVYTENILHSFSGGEDGKDPVGTVTFLEGELYGTTQNGGNPQCENGSGCGSLYKIAPSGAGYSVLYAFSFNDGLYPTSTLAAHGHALFGTAQYGGMNQEGVVFRYVP